MTSHERDKSFYQQAQDQFRQRVITQQSDLAMTKAPSSSNLGVPQAEETSSPRETKGVFSPQSRYVSPQLWQQRTKSQSGVRTTKALAEGEALHNLIQLNDQPPMTMEELHKFHQY